jgi:hypothetical protein
VGAPGAEELGHVFLKVLSRFGTLAVFRHGFRSHLHSPTPSHKNDDGPNDPASN